MAVDLEELQTFVNNFIDLTNKGIDVNLSLNYYSGQVTVNLQTTFKKFNYLLILRLYLKVILLPPQNLPVNAEENAVN